MTDVPVMLLSAASRISVAISAWQRSNWVIVKSLSTAVMDCEDLVSTMAVGKHSPPRPIAVRSKPPSKKPTIG